MELEIHERRLGRGGGVRGLEYSLFHFLLVLEALSFLLSAVYGNPIYYGVRMLYRIHLSASNGV